MTGDCTFCRIQQTEGVYESDLSTALKDAFPSAPGHLLVIPKRHVERLADLQPEEWADLFGLLEEVLISERYYHPGLQVNIGINDGPLAGQTISHVHVHIIPRREGDVPDPKGGVRWVIPATAPYWESLNE